MPKLSIRVEHRLGRGEALGRVKTLLGEVKKQFAHLIDGLEEKWNGDRGEFKLTAAGFRISGDLQVLDSALILNGDLPLAAAIFKGKIESMIRERATALFATKPAAMPIHRSEMPVQEQTRVRQHTAQPARAGSSRIRPELIQGLRRISHMSDSELHAASERAERKMEKLKKLHNMSDEELARELEERERHVAQMKDYVLRERLADVSARRRMVARAHALDLMFAALIVSMIEERAYEMGSDLDQGEDRLSPEENECIRAFAHGRVGAMIRT